MGPRSQPPDRAAGATGPTATDSVESLFKDTHWSREGQSRDRQSAGLKLYDKRVDPQAWHGRTKPSTFVKDPKGEVKTVYDTKEALGALIFTDSVHARSKNRRRERRAELASLRVAVRDERTARREIELQLEHLCARLPPNLSRVPHRLCNRRSQ